MSRAACSRSAVSSTTTGGLPGPAQIAFLPETHGLAHHTGPAGHHEQADGGVAHQVLGAFDRRLCGTGDQVRRSASMLDGLVEYLYRQRGTLLGARVGVEYHRIAGGNHANGVADDGGGRIGAGRDGADDAVGRPFHQRQSPVAGPGMRLQRFRTRRALGHQEVLLELVLVSGPCLFPARQPGPGPGRSPQPPGAWQRSGPLAAPAACRPAAAGPQTAAAMAASDVGVDAFLALPARHQR